jgi:hypothetical protein
MVKELYGVLALEELQGPNHPITRFRHSTLTHHERVSRRHPHRRGFPELTRYLAIGTDLIRVST